MSHRWQCEAAQAFLSCYSPLTAFEARDCARFAPLLRYCEVNDSEPKQSIFLFPDKNGLLLTAKRRSRNDPRGGAEPARTFLSRYSPLTAFEARDCALLKIAVIAPRGEHSRPRSSDLPC